LAQVESPIKKMRGFSSVLLKAKEKQTMSRKSAFFIFLMEKPVIFQQKSQVLLEMYSL
jgi:hypothetical protein